MEFNHEPYNKVTIRSYLQYDNPEHLISTIAAGSPSSVPTQAVLRWANGVLFVVAPFQPSESVAKEYLAGHLLWDHLDFTLMPEFRNVVHLTDKPLLAISVIDLSNHPIYGPFADWIKENLATRAQRHHRV
jgi:hypothetical protein